MSYLISKLDGIYTNENLFFYDGKIYEFLESANDYLYTDHNAAFRVVINDDDYDYITMEENEELFHTLSSVFMNLYYEFIDSGKSKEVNREANVN